MPSLQLQRESSSVLLAGMENGCGGRSLSLSFRIESTTDGSRIPRLAEFARIKDQLFRSHNAESRMEHPAFAKHLQGLVAGVRFELTTFGL